MISSLHYYKEIYWSKLFYLLICIFLILSSFDTLAQERNFKHFNKDNGLAGNVAYCIAQDNDGFIWIGTENGACRFDGTTFKTFTVEDGLTDNEVLEVFCDSRGRVWFLCYTGKLCYYYKGLIYNETTDPVLKGASELVNIIKFEEDKDGNVWIVANNFGVYTTEGKFLIYKLESAFNKRPNLVSATYFIPNTENGGVDVVLEYQLYNYNTIGRRFKNDFKIDITLFHQIQQITSQVIATDIHNQYILVGYNYYANIVLNEKKIWEIRKCTTGTKVNKLTKDVNARNFWLVEHKKGARQLNADLQPTSVTYFPDKNLSEAMTDKDGNLWFTSLDEGLFMVTRNTAEIYKSNSGLLERMSTIKNVNGVITAGTNEGEIYQLVDGTLNRFIGNRMGLSNSGLLRNIEYKANLMVMHYASGLQFYPDGKFKNLEKVSLGAMKGVRIQSDTSIYFATHVGLFHSSETTIDTLIFKERFTAISNIINDNLWAASSKHLYSIVNKKTKKHNNFDIKKHGRIIDLFHKENGEVWISTYAYGLYLLRNNQLKHIDKSQGLASNQCRSIYRLSEKEFWLVTDAGISSIKTISNKPDSFLIKNYDQSDGLPSGNIIQITSCNDTLWLATDNGLVSFMPEKDQLKLNSTVQITELKQNNIPINLGNRDLRFKSGSIQIIYSSIKFSSNNRTVFYYLLDGLDNNWNKTSQRQIEYASLSPGEYTFKVYSLDKNGIKSINTAEINFTILPQWWQTLWFKIGIAAIILTVLWYIYIRRINKVKAIEKEKLQTMRRMSELKLETLRSQLNPHFIFNSLNAIQNYLIEHDAKSASGYLNDFSKVIRKSLQLSLNNFIPLHEEAELLHSFLKLEKMRFDNRFEYNIQVDIGLKNYYVPTLVFQHYAENAVKHGIRGLPYKGQVSIIFSTLNDQLLCIIEDNGRGIDKVKAQPAEGTGLGLQLHNSRTELLNITYDLAISIKYTNRVELNSELSGTRVEIRMPILTSREIELKHLNASKEFI